MNVYGSEKVLYHLDKIEQLRNNEQPNPTHVQLIISDYCNQNCSFCFPSGKVLTPNGLKEIKDITEGSLVLDIDGVARAVTHLFSRDYCGKIISIYTDNCMIECTPEHPIESTKGFKEAAEFQVKDYILTVNGFEKIKRIYVYNYVGKVYNLEVEQERYVINGVSVHNCAYRMDGYSSNQLFKIVENNKVNNNPKRMIPWEKIEETVNCFKEMGVKACSLTGGGDPTVHPDFNKIAQLILDNNIDLSLVTNGLLLKEKMAKILTQSAWVRISVDCGTKESYAKIRSVPQEEYGIVEKNVRRFAAMPRKTLIGIGYVVTKDNYKELYLGCQQFKDWGADNVRISAIFQNEGTEYFKDIYQDVLEQVKLCKTLSDSKFTVYDNFGSRFEDLQLGNPDYSFCPYMSFTTYIGGDQNVYTCCVNSYNKKGLIGSIKDQSFKQLWEGEVKKNFFNKFDAKGCERCMFNEKNKFINNLLRPSTPHDNFV